MQHVPPRQGCRIVTFRRGVGRTNSGLSLGALLMAGAAFAWEWRPSVAYLLAALVPVVLLITFAPRMPLLHAVPRIGAPELAVTVTPIPRWDLPPDTRVLQVGIRAPTRLPDALMNLVFPYDVPFHRSHQDGAENPVGTVLTSSEEVDGDRPSHYWDGKPDLRRRHNLLYFVFRSPRPDPRKALHRLREDVSALQRDSRDRVAGRGEASSS